MKVGLLISMKNFIIQSPTKIDYIYGIGKLGIDPNRTSNKKKTDSC